TAMAKLSDKVKLVLDEARMLVLGAQILLGFQSRVFLEPSFQQLPRYSQIMLLIGLAVLLLAIALMMWPSTFHQISQRGNATQALHRFATQAMSAALFPFAISLAISFFAVFLQTFNATV